LPKTVTGQCYNCDLNPGSSAPESRMLTTQLPSHPSNSVVDSKFTTKNSLQNYLIRHNDRLNAVKAIVCFHFHCSEFSVYV